jgi:hypothetical protein
MTTAETYFYRNRGEWNWRVHFHIASWRLLWTSDLSLFRRLVFSIFILSQYLFGDYAMWTQVNFREGSTEVGHETRLFKFGMTFMRSKKMFHLKSDGLSLDLTGEEYFWPQLNLPLPFKPLHGIIEVSTTRAVYQMPLFGTTCDCTTILEPEVGEINIKTPWLTGKFSLTETSLTNLKLRFSRNN